jgi:hypothetical protein
MKQVQSSFQLLAALAFGLFAIGCAAPTQSKENLAVTAGFKVITPARPDQQAILAKLPPDKVTPVTYHGKTYYVLPDLKNNQAYVGGPTEYQAYRQARLAQQISNDNLEAAQMNQDAAMNWGGWGGWGVATVGFRR